MSIYSILAIGLTGLLFAFSAGQLGLSAYMINYWLSRQNKSFTWLIYNNTSYQIFWLPERNTTRSYILQLLTAIFGIVVAVVVFGLLITKRPLTFVGTGNRAPRRVAWPLTTTILSSLVFALALASLVVSFYDNAHHGPQTMNSAGLCTAAQRTYFTSLCNGAGGYNQLGEWFTMEAWTCRLGAVYRSSTRPPSGNAMSVLPQSCRIAYISRWWTIAPMLIPIFIVAAALFEIRRKNMVSFKEKQEQTAALYPKEQSFSSAATVTPLSPHGTLPQYSAAPELSGNDRTISETKGRQIMEAPEKAPYDEMPADKHQVYSELSANRSKVGVADVGEKA